MVTNVDYTNKTVTLTDISNQRMPAVVEVENTPSHNACILRNTAGSNVDILDGGFHLFVPDMHDTEKAVALSGTGKTSYMEAQLSATNSENKVPAINKYDNSKTNFAFTYQYVDVNPNDGVPVDGATTKTGYQAFYRIVSSGANSGGNQGYLPLTTRNVLKVALNQLGDAYGWGGMMGTNDCSGYVRDVYRCFGIDMPRSCNRNNGVAKSWDLSQMSDEDKASFIKRLPPGTLLAFNGHEMIYLGYERDKLYVISSVSNVRMPGDDHNTRIRGGVINTLDILRASNTTWLHNLSLAEIPYFDASHPDPAKLANPMKVRGRTVKVSAQRLVRAKQTIPREEAMVIRQAQGTVTYTKASVNKKAFAKKFTVNKTSGDITVKKGVKKGTYKLKIRVKAAGDANYKAAKKTVTVTIRVR